MSILNYDNQLVLERLLQAHNPDASPIRFDYMKKQLSFLDDNIFNRTVLVAGSGLGKEAKALSSQNTFVLGVDNNPMLIKMSRAYFNATNLMFVEEDFMKLPLYNNCYDASFFNWGTIGNFNELEQKRIINELMRVSQECVYMDFYTPENNQNRIEMYTQEGWKNVHVEGNAIVSDDGGHSQIFTPKQFDDLVLSADKSFRVDQYYPIDGFGYMAKIVRRK